MLDALPVAFYATDPRGQLTYFNPAAIVLSGRVPDPVKDAWCITWKLFGSDGTPIPHDRCPMATALAGEPVKCGEEYIGERPDGSRFWFTPFPMVFRDPAGRITGGLNMLVDLTERKMERGRSESEFQTIFATCPECVKLVAPDGTVLQMNAAGLVTAGASSVTDVVGKRFYDLVAPEDRERFCAFHERVCRGERLSLEFDIIGLDGVRRQMETHAAPLTRSDGGTVQLAVTRDVTGRKHAEHAALLLNAVLDSSDDAVLSSDLKGMISSWNQSAERIFGFSAAEAIGQPAASLLIPADRLHEETDIPARLGSSERVKQFETKRKRKDGTLVDVSLSISPVKDRKGATIGVLTIARDITERKRIERSALLLSAIVDSSDDAILSKDLNGVITSWNKSAERMFGYTAAEAVGQPVASLLIPADRQDEEPEILARLRRGERVDHFQTRRRRKDGALIDISLTISPVKDASGRIVGASKIARNITHQIQNEHELCKANDALLRSNADLQQFAYSASHDLQEPLRMVSAYSELLRRKFGNQLAAPADEYIGFIAEGANRMEQLLCDLRAYTHTLIAHDEDPPGVSCEPALQRSISSLGAAIEESAAEICVDPLPAVKLHEFQLEQLFQNIIGNAIRYRGRDRPRIHVGAEPDGNRWRFFVRDNGIGIDPRYQEQIFGIFKRLHTASEYPGTGMGLAICQRIVEGAGGRIWVESQPGRGSTFFFILPGSHDE